VPDGLVPSFDADGMPDGVSTTTLAGAGDGTVDFGFVGTGSVGDLVWHDLDGDSVAGAGEPGIGGIGVTLVWAGVDGVAEGADDWTFSTVTGDSGSYLFELLPAGGYTIALGGLPAGVTATADPDGGSDDRAALTLAGAGVELGLDFGYRGTSTLDGMVFLDADGNSVRGDERGVADVAVHVEWAGPAGAVTWTVRSGADGRWSLGSMPAGNYMVMIDQATLPRATAGSTPARVPVTVRAGDVAHAEHGLMPLASVGGTVWGDENRDGIRNDGERGLAGVVVRLFDSAGNLVASTITDTDGRYEFIEMMPGNYMIELDASGVPEGWMIASGPGGGLRFGVVVGPGDEVVVEGLGLVAPVEDTPARLPLPRTGGDIASTAIAAFSLVVGGGALFAMGSRRRRL
jgi:hypothetical protein